MSTLELGMAQILEALKQSTTTYEPPIRPDSRSSPAPSSQQSSHDYKPKKKDPPVFENNDGPVEYRPWKEQILDKFEEDET